MTDSTLSQIARKCLKLYCEKCEAEVADPNHQHASGYRPILVSDSDAELIPSTSPDEKG